MYCVRVISNYSKRLSKLIKSICRVTLLFHVLWCQKAHHLSEHNFPYSGVATMEIQHYVEHWCPLVLIIWPFDWINNDWNYVQSIQAGKKHTFFHWGFAIVWHFYFTPITYIYWETGFYFSVYWTLSKILTREPCNNGKGVCLELFWTSLAIT